MDTGSIVAEVEADLFCSWSGGLTKSIVGLQPSNNTSYKTSAKRKKDIAVGACFI